MLECCDVYWRDNRADVLDC
jgi:hypothetical protein